MKKIINWLKGSSSDFALLVILLILANLVGMRAFMRFDLTRQKSYSLSPVSKQLMQTLDAPLSVHVFFSNNLTAPYSTTAQYVRDILVEYKGAANHHFSYAIMDMGKRENETLASQYGLRQSSIQVLKNNEVSFAQVYMGIAVSYADAIEVIDNIETSDGFEYKLTTTISKMISTANAFAGLAPDEHIKLTLYKSDTLKQFQIFGFDEIETAVAHAYETLNKQHMNRIDYERVNPSVADLRDIELRYGSQLIINQQTANGAQSIGALGLVLERGDMFRFIPISIQRSLLGLVVSGLDDLDKTIGDSMQSLLSKATQIGYVTGHGERPLYSQDGMLPLSALIADRYEFVEFNLADEPVPASMTSIVVNAPTSPLSDDELYKIDQFIMRGGNVMFFVDPFDSNAQINPMNPYQQMPPTFAPYNTNLNTLLNQYGVSLNANYVLDELCYTRPTQEYGMLSLWYAPMIPHEQLAQHHVVTDNLSRIIFLQSSSIDIDEVQVADEVTVTPLVTSSKNSWLISDNIQLNPFALNPPYDKSTEKSEHLAVLLEGKFSSAFSSGPSSDSGEELASQTHLANGVQSGKIFVAGTSEITGPQLISGEDSKEPVALFTRNIVDYMNGNGDLCAMRTKGLSMSTLRNTHSALAAAAQYFNEFGIAVIVILFGLIMWRMRIKRKTAIHDTYNPNDARMSK
ncbi:MAG: GldG family protein [Treponema sp.]|nr:GldG family protein [Treponema sp.]